MDWQPRSDPSEFPEDAEPLRRWYEDMVSASERAGLPFAYRHDMKQLLKDAGFTDTSGGTEYRCPYWSGGDGDDARTVEIADAMLASTTGSFEETGANIYATLAMPLFTKYLGRSEQEVIRNCEQVVAAIRRRCTPLYHNVYVALRFHLHLA